MIGVNLMLAVMVAGLLVAGWFIANQHQIIVAEQAERAAAHKRIAALEDRLRMTDEAMINAGSNTQEQMGFWESEIRKLWAISNERNKKWINENQRGLASQRKKLAALESNGKVLKSALDRHEQALSQQSAVIDQLASIELQLQQLLENQQDLVDKVNASTQITTRMEARVKENEEAIAAIDAYRRSVNSRISDIEKRLVPSTGP
ncbi:MAG: hypothetical protein QF515_02095 [Pseudomonadales bacterium]|jgi:hypothetical protein|nr:hypothetical protein [Pseudomonadales bacterium]|tara:strand:- start:990 stop:1604 length:615 start_codon:yes stop_codon:yes gene_type:complete